MLRVSEILEHNDADLIPAEVETRLHLLFKDLVFA
jgi:hypothetical protein